MSTTAFPVKQTSDGIGCTDVTMRKIMAALFENRGIINGLAVAGTTSMYYTVASGVAICSKGTSDGNSLAYFEGGNTPTVSTNTTSYGRIDAVWITSHDVTQGDTDNLVTVGVTEGTAAASPALPTLPTYATLLSYMLVPAGATTTANATKTGNIITAVPHGGSLGILYDNVWNGNNQLIGGVNETTAFSGSFYVPTSRTIAINHISTITRDLNVSPDYATGSAVIWYIRLDGALVHKREQKTFPHLPASSYIQHYTNVAAGNHTVSLGFACYTDNGQIFCGDGYEGQRLQVLDICSAV